MNEERTQSQVGKMSRRKGKQFEREIAKFFTEWTDVKWETTRNSGRTDLIGDIYMPSKPLFPMVVECKHRRNFTVHAMIKPTKAFQDMLDAVQAKWLNEAKRSILVIIIKNETGVWATARASSSSHKKITFETIGRPGTVIIAGMYRWYELKDLYTDDYCGIRFKKMGGLAT